MDRYELYYQVAQSQLLEQDRRWQAVEVKARSFLTISIALLGAASLIVANFSGGVSGLNVFSWCVGILVITAICCSVGFSIGALYIRNWNISPDLEELQKHVSSLEYEDAQVIEWTADAMTQAYIQNDEILENKATMARYALIALSLKVIFLVGLVITMG